MGYNTDNLLEKKSNGTSLYSVKRSLDFSQAWNATLRHLFTNGYQLRQIEILSII